MRKQQRTLIFICVSAVIAAGVALALLLVLHRSGGPTGDASRKNHPMVFFAGHGRGDMYELISWQKGVDVDPNASIRMVQISDSGVPSQDESPRRLAVTRVSDTQMVITDQDEDRYKGTISGGRLTLVDFDDPHSSAVDLDGGQISEYQQISGRAEFDKMVKEGAAKVRDRL